MQDQIRGGGGGGVQLKETVLISWSFYCIWSSTSYMYIISDNGMTASDEFPQLLFVKVMQHGTTNFNPLAVTSTTLGCFNESGFGVYKKMANKDVTCTVSLLCSFFFNLCARHLLFI